ncbi:MAG: hypothetical protein EI684_17205 [Candidatus Viridilinea halotolerans]|uniref:Uncharacterized protein n=1 Tax=Candidatus Viridilinea halotolerans TaxID=2491704 RepID=A0A426TUD1_9CHLR|nr:MAG: hypothetical protein EI684_17205 [Candidatus Viridilinea halotolerans]
MYEAFNNWSYENLGQWHYAIGYLIVLLSHNWPIMAALAASFWFGVKAYLWPTRCNVSWLLTALLFGLVYEYDKHIATELHAAVDFLFGAEISFWNEPFHRLVGPVITTLLLASAIGMLVQSIRLSILARRARRPVAVVSSHGRQV